MLKFKQERLALVAAPLMPLDHVTIHLLSLQVNCQLHWSCIAAAVRSGSYLLSPASKLHGADAIMGMACDVILHCAGLLRAWQGLG